jgi:uncharacterized protein YjiS (DUF1127 family)
MERMNLPLSRVVRAVAHEMRIRRDVRRLEDFSDRMLADIGISRSEIPDAARGRLWRRYE